MAELFDAYAEWLQIDTDGDRPNHYELLGLPPFEDNQERIRGQYWERYEKVRQYEVGNFSEQALKLLEELSQSLSTAPTGMGSSIIGNKCATTRKDRQQGHIASPVGAAGTAPVL